MQARNKLRTAHALMALALLPLLLGICWIVSVVHYGRQHPGQAGLTDFFVMIAVFVATYGFAVVVAGTGVVWSFVIKRQDPSLRTRSATWMLIGVSGVLALPLLFLAAISLPSLGLFQ